MRALLALNAALLAVCLASVFVLERRVRDVTSNVATLEASMTVQEGELYHAHWTVANGVKRLVEVRTKRADYPTDAAWRAAHLERIAEAMEQHPPV
jgi:hypothetical protein